MGNFDFLRNLALMNLLDLFKVKVFIWQIVILLSYILFGGGMVFDFKSLAGMVFFAIVSCIPLYFVEVLFSINRGVVLASFLGTAFAVIGAVYTSSIVERKKIGGLVDSTFYSIGELRKAANRINNFLQIASVRGDGQVNFGDLVILLEDYFKAASDCEVEVEFLVDAFKGVSPAASINLFRVGKFLKKIKDFENSRLVVDGSAGDEFIDRDGVLDMARNLSAVHSNIDDILLKVREFYG